MPTPPQIKLIKLAARRVGLIDRESDQAYRMLLRNVAGVDSCKDLSQAGVEDFMAVVEDLGFADDKGATYWRDKVAARGGRGNARMIFKIRELAVDSIYPLEALCRRFSAGRTDVVEQLTPREAWQLIEMLKAATDRQQTTAAAKGSAPSGKEPGARKRAPRKALNHGGRDEPARDDGPDVFDEPPF